MKKELEKLTKSKPNMAHKERFKAAIYFHLGGLDLYPDAVRK